jgi:hypothetical protein
MMALRALAAWRHSPLHDLTASSLSDGFNPGAKTLERREPWLIRRIVCAREWGRRALQSPTLRLTTPRLLGLHVFS